MMSKIEILLIFICICELLQVIRMFGVWRNKEKEYLKAVIKPFKIRCITKSETTSGLYEFITICLDNEEGELITLPYFKKGTMYKNMETDKNYTLEELGL